MVKYLKNIFKPQKDIHPEIQNFNESVLEKEWTKYSIVDKKIWLYCSIAWSLCLDVLDSSF